MDDNDKFNKLLEDHFKSCTEIAWILSLESNSDFKNSGQSVVALDLFKVLSEMGYKILPLEEQDFNSQGISFSTLSFKRYLEELTSSNFSKDDFVNQQNLKDEEEDDEEEQDDDDEENELF